MLPLTVALEIRRLLSAGELSQRAIALRMGVARDTVKAIASGQRSLEPRVPGLRRARRRFSTQPLTTPKRCPRCGGLVYMPCRLCRVREFQLRNEQIRRLRALQKNPKSAA
jgi:transcriptional regulator with XRE-family HTH domain